MIYKVDKISPSIVIPFQHQQQKSRPRAPASSNGREGREGVRDVGEPYGHQGGVGAPAEGHEYVDEDLANKSADLLRYNPVTKKVPVLVHDGKPIAESTIIVEYIDEAWKGGYPIMPADPYERAQARFWARFAEEKVRANCSHMIRLLC